MTESSETPIGQSPATGGRVKQYATAADRAKAFRNRQKELLAIAKGSNQPGDDDLTEQPESAITTLAYAIGELRRIGEFQTHFAQRIEEAVSRVADPERLDTALETTRTQALEQVSRAQSKAADAKVEAQEARTALREVSRERDGALGDAAEALERLAATEQLALWLVAEARHLAAEQVAEAEQYCDNQIAAAERDRDTKVREAHVAQVAAEEAARRVKLAADERVETARVEAAHQVQEAHAAIAIAEASRIRADAERDAAKTSGDDLRSDLRAAREEITRLRDQLNIENRTQAPRVLRSARPITPQTRRRRNL